MKNTTKKAFICSVLGIVLTGSILSVKSLNVASADFIDGTITDSDNMGIEFTPTLLDYYGFSVNVGVDTLEPLLDDYLVYSAPLLPFVPVARTYTDMYPLEYNETLTNSTWDKAIMSSFLTFHFADVPPYYPDPEDIPDDEIIDLTASGSVYMDNILSADFSGFIEIGRRGTAPVYCDDLEDFTQRISDIFTFGLYNPGVGEGRVEFYCSYYEYTSNNELVLREYNLLDYDATLDGAYFPIVNVGECILVDYYISCEFYTLQETSFGLDWFANLSYPLDIGDNLAPDFTDIEYFISSHQEHTTINVPAPTDVLFSPVVTFLNTEFVAGFTFGDMLLISLGVMTFGLFLKLYMGG